MKVTPTTLASLVIFFGLARAQNAAYDGTCNPTPIGEQDVDSENEPGLVATYGCGHMHSPSGYAGVHKSATTPKDCAIECAQRNPEGPCSWYSGACYFYTPGASVDPYTSAVTITVRKDWDKLQAAFQNCQGSLGDCQTGLEECGNNLQDCQNAAAAGPPATGPPATGPPATGPPATGPPATGPPATGPPATGPPATGPPATGPPSSGLPDAPSAGPCIDGERFSVGGKTYQMACNRISNQSSQISSGVSTPKTTSRKECVERCAASANCKFVVFFKTNDGAGDCPLRHWRAGSNMQAATGASSTRDIAYEV